MVNAVRRMNNAGAVEPTAPKRLGQPKYRPQCQPGHAVLLKSSLCFIELHHARAGPSPLPLPHPIRSFQLFKLSPSLSPPPLNLQSRIK